MSYYLNFNVDREEVFFADSIGGASEFEIVLDFAPNSLSESYGPVLTNNQSNTAARNGIYTRPSGELEVAFIIDGSRVVYDTSGAGLAVDVRSIISIVYDGSTLKTFSDGIEVGSRSATGTLGGTPPGITGFHNHITGKQRFQLYNCRFIKDGVLISEYDPSESDGTGLVLTDIIGTKDGTLDKFPTDDSQWVFYSDGGVVMTISESATAADTESTQANLLSTISEAASASDTATGKLSASLSVSESAGASDTDTGQYATSQEIIEAVQASDLTGTLLKAILTQNLSALASDTVSLKANYGLTVSETASGTDSTAGKAALIATLSESASASDTVSIPPEGVVNLTIGEVSTAADSVSMTASFTMTISEAAQAADSVSGRAALLASISEAISATDSFDGFAPTAYTVTIGETATATDAVSIVLASLKGFITATITINPIIIGDANIEPIVAGNVDAETMINAQGNIVPMITGTITVS